ncbi:response regulator transcription factor [Seonamhaeicola maritimus]|uniref:response regulator transcription factor n=1 Tax=Seonamhaeicola maritimus TaxID=2591822 RepID=UPI002493E3C8|nr:response regulator transcription factor [Seonamhaeicola maritimus]
MIRVAITDDHAMVLRGIETMLKASNEVIVVGTFANCKNTSEGIINCKPHVLLLDINLPDCNGIEYCKILKKEFPDLHVIALTNFNETAFVKNIIRNGAKGYLLKNTDKNELEIAIKRVYRGEQYLQKSIQKKLLDESFGITSRNSFIPKLTRRELEVLQLIVDELTTNEIAKKLFISTKTVETHRSHLIQKLEVRNTAGLVKIAIEKGLLK